MAEFCTGGDGGFGDTAIEQGLETATFHILTPYPGTALHRRLEAEGRILHRDWDLYDTRHAVFRPARMSPETLERGYRWAAKEFYRWGSIARGALAHRALGSGLKHFTYAAAWKKCEPVWDVLLRARSVARARPLLERLLGCRAANVLPFGKRNRGAQHASQEHPWAGDCRP